MTAMWPKKADEFKKIVNDKHRLRAAFIRNYCDSLDTTEVTPSLEKEFDVRKYAIYMNNEDLLNRIYKRTNLLLTNPKAYSEILQTCQECISRGLEETPFLRDMSVFKIIGVAESIQFLAELPAIWYKRGLLKKAVKNLFRAVMVRTRHYAKQQYNWLKNQKDYFAVTSLPDKIEEIGSMIANQAKDMSLEEYLQLGKLQTIPQASMDKIIIIGYLQTKRKRQIKVWRNTWNGYKITMNSQSFQTL
eukprot:TRINITY_DN136907_c0_g1_i1.p2 TRINITY_DN136907_c0_g1~~TRINITY_DN136907_c0_g1_i1.p2  ORF type:complete len:246 (+),score=20.59 TRINITY_DN136907_c0_g1_i1:531-1268(+)